MNILVIGDSGSLDECTRKFGTRHQYTLAPDHRDAQKLLHSYDLIFDFLIEEDPSQFEMYAHEDITVFVNAAKISLAELIHPFLPIGPGKFFGFNGLPTFVTLPLFEVTAYKIEHLDKLKELCDALGTEYRIVDDRVGLVTARIICMIINEAFFTVEEKTATEEDIDLAMRLGTNYPFGPFEWARRIGIRHVYEVLEALHDDTKEERYKICPRLKREYLKTI